jgi:hypothetical protein
VLAMLKSYPIEIIAEIDRRTGGGGGTLGERAEADVNLLHSAGSSENPCGIYSQNLEFDQGFRDAENCAAWS